MAYPKIIKDNTGKHILTIEQKLGHGTFGDVFVGMKPNGKKVAVKFEVLKEKNQSLDNEIEVSNLDPKTILVITTKNRNSPLGQIIRINLM